MAHTASDGKKFTNKPPMQAHERSIGRMAQHSEAGGAGSAEVDPLQQPGEQEQDGSQVAQEHGPAVEINMMHDHEGGMHHVRSAHPDGHMHESQHGSAGEAHEHAKKLAGTHESEMGNQDEEAEPEYE